MHEPGGNCDELMKKTVDALSSEELQQLFVSTQQNNLDLCVEYGIKKWRLMICEIYHINLIFRTMKKMGSDGLKYCKKKKGNWAYFMMVLGMYLIELINNLETDLVVQSNVFIVLMSWLLTRISARLSWSAMTPAYSFDSL
jgi:hypothetical protein